MTTSQIMIVMVAAALAAIIKSTTGTGYPLILIPVLALFIDIVEAVVIVAPSNLYLNGSIAWSLREERHHARTLRTFTIAGGAAAALGAVALTFLPDRLLRVVIVLIIVVFVIDRFWRSRIVLSERTARRLVVPVGSLAGFLQGSAGVSGPIVIPWFLSLGLSRDAAIFCFTMSFAVSGFVQIVVFIVQGTFTLRLLVTGLALIPVALGLLPVGRMIRERMSVEIFERAVVALLVASAISIVVRLF